VAADEDTSDEQCSGEEALLAIRRLTDELASFGVSEGAATTIARERFAMEREALRQRLRIDRDISGLLAQKIAEAQMQFDAALAAIKGRQEETERTEQLTMEYQSDNLRMRRETELNRRDTRLALEQRLQAKRQQLAARHQVRPATPLTNIQCNHTFKGIEHGRRRTG
jgi:hypothetical protein